MIVDLLIRLKGNSKRTPVNLLSLFGAQNKDFRAAWLTLLTGVKLCLRSRLEQKSRDANNSVSGTILIVSD